MPSARASPTNCTTRSRRSWPPSRCSSNSRRSVRDATPHRPRPRRRDRGRSAGGGAVLSPLPAAGALRSGPAPAGVDCTCQVGNVRGDRRAHRVAAAELSLPRDIELVCYRVVREAVSNAVKHARARNVAVSLSCQLDRFTFTIMDDGRGIRRARQRPARPSATDTSVW